jgi:hypothetical protein
MWSGKILTVLEWGMKSGEEVLGSLHNTMAACFYLQVCGQCQLHSLPRFSLTCKLQEHFSRTMNKQPFQMNDAGCRSFFPHFRELFDLILFYSNTSYSYCIAMNWKIKVQIATQVHNSTDLRPLRSLKMLSRLFYEIKGKLYDEYSS